MEHNDTWQLFKGEGEFQKLLRGKGFVRDLIAMQCTPC